MRTREIWLSLNMSSIIKTEQRNIYMHRIVMDAALIPNPRDEERHQGSNWRRECRINGWFQLPAHWLGECSGSCYIVIAATAGNWKLTLWKEVKKRWIGAESHISSLWNVSTVHLSALFTLEMQIRTASEVNLVFEKMYLTHTHSLGSRDWLCFLLSVLSLANLGLCDVINERPLESSQGNPNQTSLRNIARPKAKLILPQVVV